MVRQQLSVVLRYTPCFEEPFKRDCVENELLMPEQYLQSALLGL